MKININSLKLKITFMVLVTVVFLFIVNGYITFTNFSKTLLESVYREAFAKLEGTVNDAEAYLSKNGSPGRLSYTQWIRDLMKKTEYRDYFYQSPDKTDYDSLPQDIKETCQDY